MNTLSQPFYHNHHKKPVTRRELRGQGFLNGFGVVWAASTIGVLQEKLLAADCGIEAAGATLTPTDPAFLCFDLAGGASIAGSNVIVGGQNGQSDFLPSYRTLGLPDGLSPKTGAINQELGLMMHSDSAILRGIQSVTSAATRANIEGGVFCASSADDTQNNPHNPSYWIAKSGVKAKLAALAGTESSASGGNSRAPELSIDASLKPLVLRSVNDSKNLSASAAENAYFDSQTMLKIAKAASGMSEARMRMWASKGMDQQTQDLVNCGYIKSHDLLTPKMTGTTDPRQDTDVQQVFANNFEGDNGRTALISKLAIDGQIAAGTIMRGGYDYHNNTRATGEAADFAAGQMIGQSIELAARKKRNLLVYVFTDGAVVSNGAIDTSTGGRNKGIWTSDSSLRSSSFLLVYRASGKPQLRRPGRRQIGYFNQSETVVTQGSKISGNVENLALAVVANYLALSGKEQDLARIAGKNPFSEDLENYLFFSKLT